MPVTTVHAEYAQTEDSWQRCRDVLGGSEAVKAQGERYLPRLLGQSTITFEGRVINEYESFKMRALFYEATGRTLQGLLGALFRRDPQVSVPEPMLLQLDDVTGTGIPFNAFAQTIAQEVISTGRYGVLVDLPSDAITAPQPYWCAYRAEAITNWRMEPRDGVQVLTLVVLKEEIEEVASDGFDIETTPQYRVLRLDDDGWYAVELWRPDASRQDRWVMIERLEPTIRGQRLPVIPFVFFGPTSLLPTVERPPLLGIVEVNLSHYRSSADLEHGRHFCGLPTAWVAGFPTETQLKIGSAVAWVSDNVQAKAGMLEFTGQGLGALEKALDEKEAKMAALGARMLENPRAGVEAAETIRLRTQGEHNFLETLAKTLSRGLTLLLQAHAAWMALPEGADISCEVNTDFVN